MPEDPLIKQLLRHQSLFMGYLVAMTHDIDAAEEIFQNVAVAILENAPKEPIRDFYAWAKEVVRRQALYYLRGRTQGAAVALDPQLIEALSLALDDGPVGVETVRQERKALEACVKELPTRARQMIALRYEQRQSFEEIGRAIEMSAMAVQRAISRLRKALHVCVRSKLVPAQEV